MASVDITSIGGAAYDVFVRAPHTVKEGQIQFPLGGKVKVESVVQCCGGGATNTSVGFSRLGMKARFCGVIADDEWGKGIQEALEREGVLTDAAIVVTGEVSSFSIILIDTASGDRTVLYSPNVNAHLSDPVFPKELLQSSGWIFLNHLTDVSSVILDDVTDIIRHGRRACPPDRRAGRQAGCRFAWNPGGSQIREGMGAPVISDLLRWTDILFLNAEEAATFTGAGAVPDALRALSAAGVHIACVTDGACGAFLSDGGNVWFCAPVPDVQVVDTTGAGDGFAVGVTWAIHRGIVLPTALKAGMLNAASVIGRVGTHPGLLTEKEIRTRLETTALSVTSSLLQ